MKIVVAARCMNDERHIKRFLHGYDFVDAYVISDGGSEDKSVELLQQNPKVQLHHFYQKHVVDGIAFNDDAPHMNFVLSCAKALEPDWLIFDDIDCNPNSALRIQARSLLEGVEYDQVNAFRLYLWNDGEGYFPHMNRNFHPDYTSLWAFRPKRRNIYADETKIHGTLLGLSNNPYKMDIPMCLLHYSWNEKTIDAKLKRYNAMGILTQHPFKYAGKLEPLPEWAVV